MLRIAPSRREKSRLPAERGAEVSSSVFMRANMPATAGGPPIPG